MRNTVLKVFFSLLLVLFVVSCKEPDPTIPVAGVSLSKTSLEMTVGDTEELTATVTPAEATNKKVTWTTSDANVAEIIEMRGGGGLQVIAKAPGTATITVKTEDGGKTASCDITIEKPEVPVTGVTIKAPSSLEVGQKMQLGVTVLPENATNNKVTWSSSDETIATIDKDGWIDPLNEGMVTITAMADGKSGKVEIIVTPLPVTYVRIQPEVITLRNTGATENLTVVVTPEGASKEVTWTSSDEAVATVDENGKVTATGNGEATITATSKDYPSITATCRVVVGAPTDGLFTYELDESSKTAKIIGYDLEKLKVQEGIVVIPEKYDEYDITEIKSGLFRDCTDLKEITIKAKKIKVGGSFLRDCISLTSVVFTGSPDLSAPSVFSGCKKLASVDLGNMTGAIGSSTFAGCSALSGITIPIGVTKIGSGAFNGSGLTSITIPDDVTHIDGAFGFCEKLTSVDIPASVKTIEQSAFNWCQAITKYTFRGNTPPTTMPSYLYGTSDFLIYVPDGAIDAYAKALPNYTEKIRPIVE